MKDKRRGREAVAFIRDLCATVIRASGFRSCANELTRIRREREVVGRDIARDLVDRFDEVIPEVPSEPKAKLGDELFLTVNGAERRYVVTEIMTLLPSDTWVMGPTTDETVTLITCVPIGVYSHRLIVRAKPQ